MKKHKNYKKHETRWSGIQLLKLKLTKNKKNQPIKRRGVEKSIFEKGAFGQIIYICCMCFKN